MTTFFRTLHCLKGQSSFSGQHQEIPDDPEKFWSVDNPNFYMGQMTTPIFTWVKNAKFALNFRPHLAFEVARVSKRSKNIFKLCKHR